MWTCGSFRQLDHFFFLTLRQCDDDFSPKGRGGDGGYFHSNWTHSPPVFTSHGSFLTREETLHFQLRDRATELILCSDMVDGDDGPGLVLYFHFSCDRSLFFFFHCSLTSFPLLPAGKKSCVLSSSRPVLFLLLLLFLQKKKKERVEKGRKLAVVDFFFQTIEKVEPFHVPQRSN